MTLQYSIIYIQALIHSMHIVLESSTAEGPLLTNYQDEKRMTLNSELC